MNWKEEGLDKLRQFDGMRQAVRCIPEQLEKLKKEEAVLLSTKPRGIHHRTQRRQYENRLLENRIRQRELNLSLEHAAFWLQTVNSAFSRLTPEEKLILNRFFIMPEKGACFQLCEELAREESTIYRKREQALRKFILAMYGVTSRGKKADHA